MVPSADMLRWTPHARRRIHLQLFDTDAYFTEIKAGEGQESSGCMEPPACLGATSAVSDACMEGR